MTFKGFFYKYRGNGYGPFGSPDLTVEAAKKRATWEYPWNGYVLFAEISVEAYHKQLVRFEYLPEDATYCIEF